MTNLNDRLLQNLAEWRFDNARQTLPVVHPESGWSVAVTADCADRIGCRVWELTLTRPAAAPAPAELKAWAERLSGRATGLLEALRLIEVDAERATAMLRSAAPQKRGDELSYYEVLLHSSGAAVRRYQASIHGGTREQIAFSLTHEALAKLAADLTADA